MKARYAIPIALVVCGLTFVVYWRTVTSLYYPKPDQKSSFMNSYSPENLITKYRCTGGIQSQNGESAVGGDHFVTHKDEFKEYFCASRESDEPVVAGLENDIRNQLSSNHARFLDWKKDAFGYVRIDYELGHVLGSITIHPITKNISTGRAIPVNFEDKLLHITIEEMWFPKGIPSEQLSRSSE